ncbi:unnamed protein product [Microthlaspi erraticum]|uniref:Transposase MuDR plant domain-containing protein n=1 Tax=Microthlaspi erraticum TaxID=1685480 RepID=A0A6D2IKP3_9BRAS|nr:unnamed protein product [Microthlaspi erraticum]
MVQADYMLDMEPERVELSYPLPDVMLHQMPSDFPPMYITNDGQVHSLIELGKTHVLRLCISVGNKDKDEEVEEEYDDVGDEDYVDEAFAGKKAEDTDADYSEYGKVQDEDDWEKKCFEERLRRGDMNGHGVGFNGNGSGDISIGQSYVSKDDLISALRVKAVMSRFAFKVSKSTTKLYVAKCFVDGCKWMCRAAIKNEAKRFFVTKYVKVHTCSVVDRARFRKGCTPRYLGQIFVERFGIIDGIVPRHIAAIRVMLGLKLNYTTSYRALKAANFLLGEHQKAGYAALPSYLRRVKQSNPGSVTDLYLRRVIVVDGTHLTGKYGGVLLVAAGQDANFQVFPLAFGIVDAENNESWGLGL